MAGNGNGNGPRPLWSVLASLTTAAIVGMAAFTYQSSRTATELAGQLAVQNAHLQTIREALVSASVERRALEARVRVLEIELARGRNDER